MTSPSGFWKISWDTCLNFKQVRRTTVFTTDMHGKYQIYPTGLFEGTWTLCMHFDAKRSQTHWSWWNQIFERPYDLGGCSKAGHELTLKRRYLQCRPSLTSYASLHCVTEPLNYHYLSMFTLSFVNSFPSFKMWMLLSTATYATRDPGEAFNINLVFSPGFCSLSSKLTDTSKRGK